MKTYFEEIIFNLFKFKGLPAVSSERQIGLLLMPFLGQIFSEYTLITIELPIKIESSNQSKKVDFALKSKTKNELLLVELKTDKDMFDEKQLDFYVNRKCKNIQWKNIYLNIKNIVENGKMGSHIRMKYFNLFLELNKNELISINNDFDVLIDRVEKKRSCIDRKFLGERSKDIKKLFKESSPIELSTNLIYLMPNDEKNIKCLREKRINFKTFDQLPEVENYNEEFTTLLRHLKEI